MNRDYLTPQLDDVWWATVVAGLRYIVQVVFTKAARRCFTSQERDQADQMPWAEGHVATAQGSSEGQRRGRLVAAQGSARVWAHE